MPSGNDTDLDTITVAIIEPIATVIAKSKLESLEKLRLPLIQVMSTNAT